MRINKAFGLQAGLPVSLIVSVLLIWSCVKVQEPASLPETPMIPVVDTLHGVEIVDNYRWLENGDDTAVIKWADQQDAYCRSMLSEYPGRQALKTSIEELMRIGAVGDPALHGGRYFYSKRVGEEQHERILMKSSPDGKAKIVLDPDTFSTDGTVALDWWYPSRDGKFIAFGKSSSGTENSTLFILDVDHAEILRDTIPYTGAASIAWLNDNSGFYYTRYPKPGTVPEGEEVYFRWVYFHKIGESIENDPLIFGKDKVTDEWTDVKLSPDNRYLLVAVYAGWAKSEIYLKDLAGTAGFTLLVDNAEAMYSPYLTRDNIYILTNYKAPRFRVMRAEYDKPRQKDWKEIIPETETSIENLALCGDHLVVVGLHNASSRAVIYSRDGKPVNEIQLPAIGSIMGYGDHVLAAEEDGHELLFGYHSYFIPPTIYRYDFKIRTLSVFDRIETDLDLSQFEVEQVWFKSKDSTLVSMFLTHRKDIVPNGENPTLVYGYGGFMSNETPYFSRTMTLFLQRGGIYAHVQLRGGGEYGEEWHRAGMLENKQNSFDDMIAACEWLIRNEYTSPRKLVIEGGSNGGLLVGAALVQRPDLMKAVVCSRPLLDMLRYQNFLIARLWIPEYGSADNPEQYKYLYDYSPYHHIKKGTAYPAVLFESADHDTRVDPLHARKMTAALQAATSSDNPILLRVQRQTGHGQGAPQRIILEELIDEWCFIYWQLGM
nr:S9 family peptidase [candidate division Zixibacteria bacterium]